MCQILALIILLLFTPPTILGAVSNTNAVTLAWQANPAPDIAGYIIYRATNGVNFNWATNVGNVTNCTLRDLAYGVRYAFVVTAYNTSGLESDYSNTVYYQVPDRLGEINVVLQSSTNNLTWKTFTNTVLRVAETTNVFYRIKVEAFNPGPELVLPTGQVFVMRTNVYFKLVVPKLVSPKYGEVFEPLHYQKTHLPKPLP